MELADGTRDVVDPEVRAYVSSLVSALGGSGADEDGRYVLGDDALAVLRDLKRWLKLYDEKANRLDVARCLAESNLVGGDLLPILASWPESATENRGKSKMALACLELLVPLTWPYERDLSKMTVNHHRHIPYLQLSQLSYKRLIINFDGARILHTIIRTALPSLSESLGDRTKRDHGIIKLVLYFLRNITMIVPPPNVKYDGEESEVSRSATIDAFDYQDVLHLLLTMSSTMGEEFNTEDVIVLEVLFHLIKGVDPHKVFMTESEIDSNATDQLLSLRTKEAGMKKQYARTAPTRHNRFGTMIWVKRDDAKVSTLSGQDALIKGKSLDKMDKSKKYQPPRRNPREETGPLEFDASVPLTIPAYNRLRKFVEEFLDSGFNPLFEHLRKTIEREAGRVLDSHRRQFFYCVSWFLEADQIRRSTKKQQKKRQEDQGLNDFALVASVLNQEMFVALNRAMEEAYDNKSWGDLKAIMRCFTQILLTVQEMSESQVEDDRDIAENILSRIFYEETTHDRVANIVRQYKDQGFYYLNLCTELAHHYLRILESYSKQNNSLLVRSSRKVRRKKSDKTADAASGGEEEEGYASEEEDALSERLSRERKFDFTRFAAKFTSQGCIDTFVAFCRYYNDLTEAQLKRAHRFFYRIAFKMDHSVMLFRVDIIALLHKMIKGPEGLDRASSMYKDWEELVRQILKKCIRKIEERPELFVEMLFSKTSGTAYYLEYGHEKQTIAGKRPAAELDFKSAVKEYDKIGVLVAILLEQEHGEWLEWIKSQLLSAARERQAWKDANKALASVEGQGDTSTEMENPAEVEQPKAPQIPIVCTVSEIKQAMFKNGHLRLLMTTVGMQLISEVDDPNTTWVLPSSLTPEQLETSAKSIELRMSVPLATEDEYGAQAKDLIKRKIETISTSRPVAAYDDDSDDGIDDEEFLFPAGGPTTMKPAEALAQLKKSRQRRKRSSSEEPTEEELQARRAARKAKELEKLRRFKSDLYIHDSDEASDEERDRAFFAQEEKLREETSAAAINQLLNGDNTKREKSKTTKRKKRASSMISSDSEDELASGSSILSRSKRARAESDDDDLLDTPLSSQHTAEAEAEHDASRKPKQRTVGGFVVDSSDDEDSAPSASVAFSNNKQPVDVEMANAEDSSDEDVPVVRPTRQRTRGGFLIDDSDEE